MKCFAQSLAMHHVPKQQMQQMAVTHEDACSRQYTRARQLMVLTAESLNGFAGIGIDLQD